MTTTSSLQVLFQQQRRSIEAFFADLDLEAIEEVLKVCLACKGLIILTGVGKSGIIAEKIAMTLISTGTRALYLPAFNFLHGDIGGVSGEDVVLMLSKSGRTTELLQLVPHLKGKGCQVIAGVSEKGSPLGKMADLEILLPVERELCPFDLAPTISTEVQLLFGDLLAIALMQEKDFKLEDFAGNHPSGSIGKRVSFLVKDLMKTGEELPICSPGDRLVEVIVKLSDKRCGCLLIQGAEQELLGIFTDGDLRRGLQDEGPQVLEKRMEELMSREPIHVTPEMLAHRALQTMQEKKYVMVAPVIDNGKLVGLIRMHDIVHKEI